MYHFKTFIRYYSYTTIDDLWSNIITVYSTWQSDIKENIIKNIVWNVSIYFFCKKSMTSNGMVTLLTMNIETHKNKNSNFHATTLRKHMRKQHIKTKIAVLELNISVLCNLIPRCCFQNTCCIFIRNLATDHFQKYFQTDYK